MTNECVICKRIPAKIVFVYTHRIFDDAPPETIHAIAVKAYEIINAIDEKQRIFFCGRSQSSILSGLFYLLSFQYGKRKTISDISRKIVSYHRLFWHDKEAHITSEATVSKSYKRWLRLQPNFFPTEIHTIFNEHKRIRAFQHTKP